ncbi:transcriptional repressor [uncultured Oxalicibacterium sp.]|uniref:Fur family transcriptional regulator n=1 Tax=uncultured Oxalicibacterium sp. TaxID=1168540 RepID=UPI0025E18533|nr:transcriptional repressor [uncultured Oxalicibacterium sp.]
MKKNVPDYLTLAESQLRSSSLRTTDARLKVLAALLGARHALSHQDVQDMFQDMDRVTLYRTLDGLTEAGLAHKISGDDRVFRYNAGIEEQDAHGHTHHQHGHFKCTQCAKVFCIDDLDDKLFTTEMESQKGSATTLRQKLQKILQDTLGKGFQSHEIELTIKGRCAECASPRK